MDLIKVFVVAAALGAATTAFVLCAWWFVDWLVSVLWG